MSLQTWIKEFYPVSAFVIETEDEAIAHSTRKWTGLLPENLKRHHVKLDAPYLIEENETVETAIEKEYYLTIDSITCALCELYLEPDPNTEISCEFCPLKLLLNTRCDINGPYNRFLKTNDPIPMLEALKRIN